MRFAKSIVDYIFRWTATKFLSPEAQFRAGVNLKVPSEESAAPSAPTQTHSDAASGSSQSGVASGFSRKETKTSEYASIQAQEDAPPCSTCGSLMIRSGSCYKCTNCGTTSGCA